MWYNINMGHTNDPDDYGPYQLTYRVPEYSDTILHATVNAPDPQSAIDLIAHREGSPPEVIEVV